MGGESLSNIDDNFKNLPLKINEFNKLKFKDKSIYIHNLKKWLISSVERNLKIKKNNKLEKVNRIRQNVYCIDYGVNIGSEFNYFHFGVVIKEFDYTAIIVPLSTEKENDADWKSASNLIVPIGVIDDMPKDKKPVYAMINQIKTVSKQRLTDYYVKEEKKYYPMTLSPKQMQTILDVITMSIGQQKVREKKKPVETV